MQDTISIVKGFVDAVNNRELDEALSMFDEGATLSAEPPLPRSPKRIYSGRGEIGQWLGELVGEHLNIVASNWKAAGNEVSWDARISADRFDEMGIGPVQAHVRTVVDGSFIRSISFHLSPESVKKMETVTAAQPS